MLEIPKIDTPMYKGGSIFLQKKEPLPRLPILCSDSRHTTRHSIFINIIAQKARSISAAAHNLINTVIFLQLFFLSFILSLELLTKNTRKHMRILDLIRKMNCEEWEAGLYSEKGRLRIPWDELHKRKSFICRI